MWAFITPCAVGSKCTSTYNAEVTPYNPNYSDIFFLYWLTEVSSPMACIYAWLTLMTWIPVVPPTYIHTHSQFQLHWTPIYYLILYIIPWSTEHDMPVQMQWVSTSCEDRSVQGLWCYCVPTPPSKPGGVMILCVPHSRCKRDWLW